MKSAKLMVCIALGMVPGAALAAPQNNTSAQNLQQEFEKYLPKMASDNLGEREVAQRAWQDRCVQAGAPGQEAARAEACKLMVQKLEPETPSVTRLWLLKQLQAIGKAECVDAVAAALNDKDDQVRDAAARCLAANPAPEATDRLLARLPMASAKDKIALLNALCYRAAPSALEALTRELGQPDSAVAQAAARALGKIATPEAARALAAARGRAKDQLRVEISNAYLRCAERELLMGKTAAAASIYQELGGAEEPRSIRLAALEGTLKTAGDKAGELVLRMIGGKDADAQNIATATIEAINPAALKTVAAGFDRLPVPAQIKVLGALAARGDRSQLPVALAAIKGSEDSVQKAGVMALGKLGDVSVVAFLLEAVKANGKLSAAARESLALVAGKGVNEQLIAALDGGKDVVMRGQLIAILESRRVIAAVPAVLKDVHGDDAGLRKRAIAALQKLAEPEHLPGMVRALLQVKKGPEREEMERTIVAVCGKIVDPEKRPEPVLKAYLECAPAEQPAVLPLLGRLGGAKALVLIRSALAGNDAALNEGAFAGLCNWPDPSVSAELLQFAQDSSDLARRKTAYRALIRVNSIATAGANPARLAMLKKAMELAQGNDDRKLVLQGLATVKDIETLRFVLPYLDKSELSHEACKTVVELAHSKKLREPNQTEFFAALDRVIALCQQSDRGLADRAKGYKQGN